MSPSVDPLMDPPRLFAQPYSSRFPEPGSLDAYLLAIKLGADGLFSAARTGSSGEVVLGRARRRLGRAAAVVGLAELYDEIRGTGVELALVVETAAVAGSVLEAARKHAEVDRLWICAADIGLLEQLRIDTPATRLVHVCDPGAQPRGAEQHAARLRRSGVDAVLVPEDRATAGLVALMHRFGRLVLAQGTDHERTAARALGNGVDGLTGSDVEILRAVRDGEVRPPF